MDSIPRINFVGVLFNRALLEVRNTRVLSAFNGGCGGCCGGCPGMINFDGTASVNGSLHLYANTTIAMGGTGSAIGRIAHRPIRKLPGARQWWTVAAPSGLSPTQS